MSDDPPILDYRPTSTRTRRTIRIVIAIALISLVGLGLRSLFNWYWPHFKAYQDQIAVEAVIAPLGAVLYSEDPTEIARLTGQAQYEFSPSQGIPPGSAIERVSASYSKPENPGTRFRSGMAPIGLRRVPGGPWRLVNINGGQYGSLPDGSRNVLFPVYDVLTRFTAWPGSRERQLWYGINGLVLAPTDRITLRAGQLDPADESHFTFDYSINGSPGTVDGYLGADDNVRFTIRTGPATTRPYNPRFGRQSYP